MSTKKCITSVITAMLIHHGFGFKKIASISLNWASLLYSNFYCEQNIADHPGSKNNPSWMQRAKNRSVAKCYYKYARGCHNTFPTMGNSLIACLVLYSGYLPTILAATSEPIGIRLAYSAV